MTSSHTQLAIGDDKSDGTLMWVLLQGMRSGTSNGGKVLSTSEIASIADEQVPELDLRSARNGPLGA